MAVSKRTRFEVLRRDEYACRYCGATAPDAKLVVDHVMPVALGGSDKPENLVSCCSSCNGGKAATSPDERVVADVSERAVAMGKALRDVLAQVGRRVAEEESWTSAISTHWDFATDQHGYPWARLPDDWQGTVLRWRSVGVPESVILNAIDTAMRKRNVASSDKWRYTCGIVWRTLDQATQEVTGNTPSRSCGHCTSCIEPDLASFDGECFVYNPHPDDDEQVCPECGSKECLYHAGYVVGIEAGIQHEFNRNYEAIRHYQKCEVRP